VETLAGNSSSACPGGGGSTCGDGGAATSALLIAPRGVAVANTGDVFIADTGAGRVRRVQASDGTILSFAGSGASATSAPRSWLSLPLPASSVAIRPVAVVVDQSGRVLIAEAALDGTGTAAVTSAIWIVPTVSLTQSFPHTSSGMISLLAGAAGVPGFGGDGGPASLALLSGPVALALDSIGRLLVADKFNNRIRRIDLDHRVSADSTVTPATYVDVPQIETIAGTGAYGYAGDGGSALTAQFRNPTGIAINPVTDDIYIVDEKNNRIRLISNKTGKVSAFAGLGVSGDTGDGGLATLARVSLGWAQVAVDLFGTVYLADRGNNRLR
ncbi:unnamed protein product, partial [Polarella glacialis]